jgi:DNA mismatch endonuclease (patch repair protein)
MIAKGRAFAVVAASGLHGNLRYAPMVDRLTPEQYSGLMRKVRGKDKAPEMIVRRLAHGAGFRYRLHHKDLPGKPDLCFPARRKVIFVHGCFWHDHNCKLGRLPKFRPE